MALKICTEVELIKRNYDSTIQIVDGLFFRQKDIIKTIEYYSNSKYLNGNQDELGREKPFYNVGNAMCDVENAATDLDTKDINATSDDGQHYTESFVMTKDIYQWMKVTNFAKTINDMRDTRTRYGSLIAKKCYDFEGDKKILKIEVPEWKNMITDQVDIINSPIIECHWMTPTQILKKKEWDQKAIKELITRALKAGSGRRIPIYEVRGEFPQSFIKECEGKKPSKNDEITFSYQLYYLAGDIAGQYGEVNQPTDLGSKMTPLYWEDNTEKVYKYLARKKKAGRAFGVGVIEEGEEAQVWTNDAVLKQYRAMEYTSKVVGQTASKKLKGRNILTQVDDGQILEHEDNKPITSLQLLPAGGLTQYNNLIVQWYSQFEKATSAYSAQRGESPASGTPFRLQAAVINQSSSVFEDLQEEFGIFVTELFEDWIMPYLAKHLNKQHILAHEFSVDELKEIDKNFAIRRANELAKQMILNGKIVTPEDYNAFYQSADEFIKRTKTKRFLDIPKDYYKEMQAKITINVTGEQRNKAAVLESLINIMTVYSKNPAIIQDPVLTQIFMRIVELSGAGISPASLVSAMQERAEMVKQQQLNAQTQTGQEEQNPANPTPSKLSLNANPTPTV